MEKILKLKSIEGYPRNVYVITDGWVSDVKNVLKTVEKNLKNQRVFSIGIGSGFDQNLVVGIAEKGKGKNCFVVDVDKLDEVIIELLE